MKAGRAFLMIFLLPLLAVAGVAMLVNMGALYSLKQQHGAGVSGQKSDLAALHEATSLAEEMAAVQQRVADLLKQADAGALDEGDVYRVHAGMVDHLAELAQRVRVLSRSPDAVAVAPEDAAALVAEFDGYRNYVVMATDIAAIDPAMAGRHIGQARDYFIAFARRAHHIADRLGHRVEESGTAAAAAFDRVLHQAIVVVVAGLIAMLALATAAARVMARRVTTLADGLARLAHERGEPPPLPAVEHLRDRKRGEFRELAGAVLSFRQALIDRRSAETKLFGYQQHLEELVATRTRQLAEARDVAEAANRAKSIFLANMSHELRTPLNAILGFAQILERDARLPDDSRRGLATISRAGHHLLTLINDVLEISRIEAGRTRVVSEAFDLDATLATVAEMIRPRAEAKGLAFTITRPDTLPSHVVGDAGHLRQVLINLLGNAIKYTEHGRIGLDISVTSAQTLRFEVSDTGSGIPRDEHERIFQAFYQTREGIAKGEGTGLGLTISQEFVHLMGGEISLDSEPGRGSRFSFTLALPPADDVPRAGNGLRVVGFAPGQTPPRILVAEDHPDNRQVVTQLLEQVGFQVRTARDGREAVELFQSWQPQLILMDMRMPEMDGYAATRAIRALPAGDRLPIVALTASAFEEDRGAILAAGCDEMVRKPFEEAQLFDVIGRLLGLCYTYARPEATRAGAAATDLRALPEGMRRALAESAIALDKEATLAIVERLRPDHPGEAELLTELVENYRFDAIEALCG